MTMLRPPGTQAARQEELAAAYRHCAAIAARHGKSYHLATRLLTADRRPAVHALYAAARTADDLVDHPGADPAGDLAEWSRAVLDDLGRGWSDDTGPAPDGWETDTEMVRSAYRLHAEDDDFGQAGTLVREVFDEAQRDAFVTTVSGALSGVTSDEVLDRAFSYWKSVDATVGGRIEAAVRAARTGAEQVGV